ncbi:MAG TPA: 4Fe-4S binding protein [Anaerolineae bacterium]|nr:4Fe-4S binding protein [Anaerolineae bacterium]HOQ99122.1 4Fe-4S binding protein [Anaerolineae bacterium]HPL27889.1 4Fe-4S binding protein [Anaerolineae bacterium]
MSDLHQHYVCTREEAREILARHDRFWVSDCGCRAGRGGCARSRLDLCLALVPGETSSPAAEREVTRAAVEEILHEAEEKHLVVRPFRDEARTQTVGLCFCCDDCCAYSLRSQEIQCDQGASVERTERSACSDCGDCVAVCHSGARRLEGSALVLDTAACYGCGLCADVCPSGCITMVKREP